jgi:DNA-binding NarL/FixJ family response regulator
LIGREPSPAMAFELIEDLRRRLEAYGDAELREVATAKMEGYSNNEIAGQLGRSMATVERKRRLIRQT